jgi:hypothetical protein
MIKSGSGAVRTVPRRTRCDSARPTFYQNKHRPLVFQSGIQFILSLSDSPTEHSNFPTDLSVSVQGSRERVLTHAHMNNWFVTHSPARPGMCAVFFGSPSKLNRTLCACVYLFVINHRPGCQNNKRDIFGLLFARRPYVFVLIPFDVAFLIC